MPQALQYFAPGTKERKELDRAGETERKERSKMYDTARRYFNGDHDAQLDAKDGEPDDNIIVNMVKMSIERQASFLFPDMPKFEIDTNSTEESDDEKWLRECFEENGGLHLLHEIAETSALIGHVYIRVRPPNIQKISQYPRFLNIDPRKIITFWHPEDIDHVVFHEMKWTVGQRDHYIQDVVFVDDPKMPHWKVLTYKTQNNHNYELQETIKWPFPQGPIVDWPHLPNPHEFYGRADFTYADKRQQDSINLMYSEMARINRYHSSPRTILFGIDSSEVKPTAIESAWSIANEKARAENLEMKSDLQSARAIASDLSDTYLHNKRIVVLKGQVKDFQRVTNAGVRTVFLDMIAKNIVLLSVVKRGLRDIAHRATLISNDFAAGLVPTIVVRDPLPTDMKEIADIMAIERSMKTVSRETASTKLGHLWVDELDKMERENDNEVLNPMSALDMTPGGAIANKQAQDPSPEQTGS
jgi:hypothetical protein